MNSPELQAYRKQQWQKIKNALLVFLLLLVIGVPLMFGMRLYTQGHRVFREAKNARLAYRAIGIEFYGNGRSIYNPAARDGMADGVKELLSVYMDGEYDLYLTGYDKKERSVTSFTYVSGNYIVNYEKDAYGREDWTISYQFPFLHYDFRDMDKTSSEEVSK